MQSVAELRRSGLGVRVNHLRVDNRDILKIGLFSEFFCKNGKNLKNSSNLSKILKRTKDIEQNSIFCRGGKTIVTVTTKDGKEFKEEVICSINDPYNKKVGIKIGLGRINKKIGLEQNI